MWKSILALTILAVPPVLMGTVFSSLSPTKLISTAAGGSIVTRDLALAYLTHFRKLDPDAKENAWSLFEWTVLLACRVKQRDEDEEASRYFEIADLFVRQGAHVNFKDDSGLTALHQAVVLRCPEGIQFLLAHGADIFARSTELSTAPNQTARAWFSLSSMPVNAQDRDAETLRLLIEAENRAGK
jgi:hypothetical protein